jgi:hypothetical protein
LALREALLPWEPCGTHIYINSVRTAKEAH